MMIKASNTIIASLLFSFVRGEITRQECINQGGIVIGDIGNGAIFKDDYLCENNGQSPSDLVIAAPGEPIASDGEVCCGGKGEGMPSRPVPGGLLPPSTNEEELAVCITDKDCHGKNSIIAEERMKNGNNDNEYYCSKGVCRPFGYCDTLADCYNPSNTYFEVFCLGERTCTNNLCGKDCTTQNDCPKGLDMVNCLASPCDVSSSCVDDGNDLSASAVSCAENYCGGCNALWFDAAGHHICKDQTVYPKPIKSDDDTYMNNNNNNGICGSPTDSCMNEQNHQECNDLKLAGCKSIMVLESCPLQFDCENEEQLSPVDQNDNLEGTISSSSEEGTSSAVSKMKNTFYLFVVFTIAATGVGFF